MHYSTGLKFNQTNNQASQLVATISITNHILRSRLNQAQMSDT